MCKNWGQDKALHDAFYIQINLFQQSAIDYTQLWLLIRLERPEKKCYLKNLKSDHRVNVKYRRCGLELGNKIVRKI